MSASLQLSLIAETVPCVGGAGSVPQWQNGTYSFKGALSSGTLVLPSGTIVLSQTSFGSDTFAASNISITNPSIVITGVDSASLTILFKAALNTGTTFSGTIIGVGSPMSIIGCLLQGNGECT